ncbi:ABC transporter substrate-binding protein [Marinobacterium zhoushanense]|uniref:ABC transporter substrate-binding protein n=1 Tax=Marinobacterium zhoushanense TaxID=1679163 RepID=A0ABQ1KAY4_9GAMM|nr:ABC transporter substrate-binding protein [Marinobacterium zhoushanense]GGB93228.1 ABC transporter substrate-binding protein [Marinobacterium zhoushanense]
MNATLLRTLFLIALYLPALLHAESLPQVRVGMLQFGTGHWELAHIQEAGLDRAEGYELVLTPLANSSAGLLALTSGSVDWIIGDWVWAAKRTRDGEPLRFLPFSTQIGQLMVPVQSDIDSIGSLAGKRIGVAGGPQGKSWQLLNAAARQQGMDLEQSAQISFGSPPLLSRELEAGRLDALLTFWHFAARLEASGQFKPAFSAQTIMTSLGIDPRLPTLGYLANELWVEKNQSLARAFKRSVYASKQDLRSDTPWLKLRSLMRADTDPVFEALKRGFREGEPLSDVDSTLIESARAAWPLFDATGLDEQGALPISIFAGVERR